MSEKAKAEILEEEGEIAADYLEDFLDITDYDGDIDIDVKHDRASVEVLGDKSLLGDLIGADGSVLDALQDLTRLAVQARTGERSGLMLDIGGFRSARRLALEDLGRDGVTKVKETGVAVQLDPMNSFERKVVHDIVAEAGLVSESVGTDPNRCVIIALA
jgi:spoIIIJ-associated protein